MARYTLKSKYALRSYIQLPHMCIIKRSYNTVILTKKEWDFLLKCDGVQDIQLTEEEQKWWNNSRVRVMVKEDAGPIDDWQKPIAYDNYFFTMVEWRITDRCNYNCLHCYNAADESANSAMWDLEDAYGFLDQARDCGVQAIILSGGEPMMHPHFLDIYKAVYERGMYVSEILTNGYYLTQEILDEILKYGYKPLFKVSFDGFGYHDWMRDCVGAEKTAIKAFELLAKNGFPILVNSQINNKNKDTFKKSIDYFDSLGVGTLRFIRTTEVPRWMIKAGDSSISYEEYFDFMLEVAKEYSLKERNMNMILWEFAFLFKDKKFKMFCTRCRQDDYRDTIYACPTVRKQICISANGNIYPCSQQSGGLDSRGIKLGNVHETKFSQLLKEGPYIDLVTMNAGDIKANNSKCGSCEHFKQCIGGCRALGMWHGKTFYDGDPAMCMMYEKDYESQLQDVLPGWTNVSASPGHISNDDMC